jgi:hypothetical protein
MSTIVGMVVASHGGMARNRFRSAPLQRNRPLTYRPAAPQLRSHCFANDTRRE